MFCKGDVYLALLQESEKAVMGRLQLYAIDWGEGPLPPPKQPYAKPKFQWCV